MLTVVDDQVMTSLKRVVGHFFLSEHLLTDTLEKQSTTNSLEGDSEARLNSALVSFSGASSHLKGFLVLCGNSMPYAMSLFETFKARVEKATTTLEQAIAEFDKELSLDAVREHLIRPQDEYKLLLSLVTQLTPEYLAVQSHVWALISSGPSRTTNEVEQLYAPLLAFRNEYFATPRAGMLSEYLAIAGSLTSSSLYKAQKRKLESNVKLSTYLQDAVERHADELEVFSLMETLSLERNIR